MKITPVFIELKKNPCEALNTVLITVSNKYKLIYFYGHIFLNQNIKAVKRQVDKSMKNWEVNCLDRSLMTIAKTLETSFLLLGWGKAMSPASNSLNFLPFSGMVHQKLNKIFIECKEIWYFLNEGCGLSIRLTTYGQCWCHGELTPSISGSHYLATQQSLQESRFPHLEHCGVCFKSKGEKLVSGRHQVRESSMCKELWENTQG